MGTTPVFRNRAWAATTAHSHTHTHTAFAQGANNKHNYQRPPAQGPAPARTGRSTQQTTNNTRGRCDVCCAKLALLGRKRTCFECGKTVCPTCLQGPSSTEGPRCKRCQLMADVPQEADRLMDMHVRDLRTILNALGVASDTCCEKSELVELVMRCRPVPERRQPVTEPEPDPEPEPEPQPEPTEEVEEERTVAVREEAAADGRRLAVRDLESEDDIEALSVQQLKGLLLRASVDYRGCCEKWELVERTKRLWRETRDNACALKEDDACRICMDAPIDCVLLECGHMATCTACGRTMNECPFCRQYVVRAVHIFRA